MAAQPGQDHPDPVMRGGIVGIERDGFELILQSGFIMAQRQQHVSEHMARFRMARIGGDRGFEQGAGGAMLPALMGQGTAVQQRYGMAGIPLQCLGIEGICVVQPPGLMMAHRLLDHGADAIVSPACLGDGAAPDNVVFCFAWAPRCGTHVWLISGVSCLQTCLFK